MIAMRLLLLFPFVGSEPPLAFLSALTFKSLVGCYYGPIIQFSCFPCGFLDILTGPVVLYILTVITFFTFVQPACVSFPRFGSNLTVSVRTDHLEGSDTCKSCKHEFETIL